MLQDQIIAKKNPGLGRRKTHFYEDQKKFTFQHIEVPQDLQFVGSPVVGVMGYLGSYTGVGGNFERASNEVIRYCTTHINYMYKGKGRVEKMCKKIQEDFPKFRQWCKGNIERTEIL